MQGSYSKAYLQPAYWEPCGEWCYFRQRKVFGRKAGCRDRLGIYSPSPPRSERHSNDLPIATILFREFLASIGITSGIISIARRRTTILCHCAGILHPRPQDTSTPLNTKKGLPFQLTRPATESSLQPVICKTFFSNKSALSKLVSSQRELLPLLPRSKS
jgi:hypothetical protein